MIVVATWPMLRAVQARLWGSRALAVTTMTLVMGLVIAAPLATAVVGIADRTDDIVAWYQALAGFSVPSPPNWVAQIPLVGRKIANEWAALAAAFLRIFAGVLGGLLAFGLVGLFVGPVVLAVTYPLLEAWVIGPGAPPSSAAREL